LPCLHLVTCTNIRATLKQHIFRNARKILTNLEILLATFLTEILVSERFSHFEREVRLTWKKLSVFNQKQRTCIRKNGLSRTWVLGDWRAAHFEPASVNGDRSPTRCCVRLRAGDAAAEHWQKRAGGKTTVSKSLFHHGSKVDFTASFILMRLVRTGRP